MFLQRPNFGALLLALPSLALGCSVTKSEALQQDQGRDAGVPPLDAGSDDGGGGQKDGGDIDDGKAQACAAWCGQYLECRRLAALEFVGRAGEGARCDYPNPEASAARCQAYCEDELSISVGGARTPASEECLRCEVREQTVCGDRQSCRPSCNGGELSPSGLEWRDRGELVCTGAEDPTNAPACGDPRAGNVALYNSEPTERSFDYLGAILVEATTPLRVRLSNGNAVDVAIDGLPSPPLTIGATISAHLVSVCPWWCDASFTLFDDLGRVIYAAWKGGPNQAPPLPEVTVSYRPSPCTAVPTQCGVGLTVDLLAGPRMLRVPVGTSATIDGLSYHHASGEVEYELGCTDYPGLGLVSGVTRP